MPRSLGQFTAAKDKTAVEPIVLLEVTWGGSLLGKYADRDYSTYDGKILTFSGIKSQKNNEHTATTAQCSFSLSDHLGDLQSVMDNYDLEGSWAEVYFYFAGSPGTKTLMFKGHVADPISWDEASRVLSFEIESAIESDKVGYATQEGDFNANYEVGYGKVWPLCFGTVAHVPAVLVRTIPETKTTKQISFADSARYAGLYTKIGDVDPDEFEQTTVTMISSLLETPVVNGALNIKELNSIKVVDSSNFPQNELIKIEIDGVIFDGRFVGNTFNVTAANGYKWTGVQCGSRPDPNNNLDYKNPKVLWLHQDHANIDLVHHHLYWDVEYTVRNPKTGANETVTYTYENVCVRQEGLKCWFKYPFEKGAVTGIASDDSDNWVCPSNGAVLHGIRALPSWGLKIDLQEFIKDMRKKLSQRLKNAAASDNAEAGQYGPMLRQLDLLRYIKNAFWSKNPGATVKQWNPDNGDIYVANAVESTAVLSVYGKRTLQGKEYFEPIPESYYTLRLDDATGLTDGPATVTSLEFTRSIDSFMEQGWKRDQIWVSLTSTLSNNSATAIKAILDSYTTLTTDATSFAEVAAAVSDYPINFALMTTKDALAVAREMAWQSRCALVTDGSDVKIRYLSPEPSTVSGFTLDEDVTQIESLRYGYTPTSELATVFTTKWRRTYAPEPFDKERVYHWNNYTDVWGVHEKSVDMYIYNDPALVAKTIEFWGNRLCRIWRKVSCTTFTDAMLLEVFDCVATSFSSSIINPGVSKGIVDSISHDFHDKTIKLDVWLPVEQGLQAQSDYAWLADTTPSTTDPTSGLSISKASIMMYRNALDLDEVYREIRKLENEATHLAKVVALFANNRAKLHVQYLSNGPFEDPDPQVWEVWNATPYHNLKIGDIVAVKTGQDGIHYPTLAILPTTFGIITTIGEKGSYTVRLIQINDDVESEELETPAVSLPAWAENYNEDEIGLYDEKFVTAINISEMHMGYSEEVGGSKSRLRLGQIVRLLHHSKYTTESDDGFWFFEAAVPILGTVFAVTLTQTGGSQGDFETQATWTYTVKDLAGDTLAVNVDPISTPHLWTRPLLGQVRAATAGYAHWEWDESKVILVLGWINEVPEQEGCT